MVLPQSAVSDLLEVLRTGEAVDLIRESVSTAWPQPVVAALKRSFQGTGHQRCRVHFPRNLLAHMPETHTDMVPAVFRTIVVHPDLATVAASWDEVRGQLAGRFPKIGTLMDNAKTEVLAFTAFPRPHWPKSGNAPAGT